MELSTLVREGSLTLLWEAIRKLNWQHYCKQVTTKGSALNGGISIFINPLPRLRKRQEECMEWQLHSWAQQLWLPADLWVIKPMRSGNSWKGSTNWTKWVIPKEKENMKETYWRPLGSVRIWGAFIKTLFICARLVKNKWKIFYFKSRHTLPLPSEGAIRSYLLTARNSLPSTLLLACSLIAWEKLT